MTVWAAKANGNLTSSSTWESTDSTSYSNSESANSALTTSQVSSTTFTPGAITIDGIGVKIASRAASPSGTMTVQLTQGGVLVTGTNVTINVSDLPTCTASSTSTNPVQTAEGGWVFFKFGSPVTLTAATAYAVSAATSVSSQVNLWSASGTNWSRYLRTTTTGSPVAGDDLIITGEWTAAGTVTARTVTMDSTTATAYGSNTTTEVTPSLSICTNGTLSFGTAASTNYILNQLGHIVIYNGGTLNIGTSGTPIPSGSTATLEFQCTNSGDFGVVVRNGGTFNTCGVPRTAGKNVIQTKLTANLAAAGTTVSVADDTGWLNGDVVCFAPTTTTATQFETKILSGNASSGGFSLTAGATNAHLGTAPIQAEVGLLTRNVVVTSQAPTKPSFVWWGNTSNINFQWTEFSFLSQSGTKPALSVGNTTGTASITYCSIHDSVSWGIVLQQSLGSLNNITFQNCVVYNSNSGGGVGVGALQISGALATTGWTFDHIMFCGSANASNTAVGLVLTDVGGTLTNCSVSGFGSSGISVNEGNIIGTFSNIVCHSNNTNGIVFGSTGTSGTISNYTAYRNGGSGISFTASTASAGLPVIINTANIWANGGGGSTTGGITIGAVVDLVLNSVALNGDTSFNQANGLTCGASSSGTRVVMHGCNFSTSSGILNANGFEFGFGNQQTVIDLFADNCVFANSANLYEQSAFVSGGNNSSGPVPWLRAQNFNQTANDNRAYYNANNSATHGLVQTDTGTVYSTNTRSEKMTPQTAAVKLQSSSIFVTCPSGKAATPIVQVQKNGSYNGNAPRLILKRQDSMGVTSDTVLATFSAGSGSWQGLTGTTSAAPQDGVFEFMIDCDGTAGSIFVGNVTATVA